MKNHNLKHVLIHNIGDTRQCPQCRHSFIPCDRTQQETLQLYNSLYKTEKNMDSIYKLFTGKYIDLSKMISVSNAEFIHKINRGWDVRFEINFQLLDNPLVYQRSFSNEEFYYSREPYELCAYDINGGLISENKIDINSNNLLAVHNLQKQIDNFIQDWRKYKNEKA